MLTDTHTHNRQASDGIIAVGPADVLQNEHFYSVGIHPWQADESSTADAIASMLGDERVVAIGETGLDRLRGADLTTVQVPLFIEHALLAEQSGLPLIIHCVRATDQLLAIHRRLRPKSPWIVHGFRGKPAQADQLTRAGIYLSLGPLHNPDTARAIPPDRLLIETDDHPTATIADTAATIAAERSTTPSAILNLASRNLNRLLKTAD